jgi:autotransporter adhesin
MGTNSTASGSNSIAMGYYSTASQQGTVAMGETVTASGTNSIAIGHYTTASTALSVALGTGNSTGGINALALGTYMTVNGVGSIGFNMAATGSQSTLNQDHTMAIMNGNVGIGTVTPAASLEVYGTGKFGFVGIAPRNDTTLIVGRRGDQYNCASMWLTPQTSTVRGWVVEAQDDGSSTNVFNIVDKAWSSGTGRSEFTITTGGNVNMPGLATGSGTTMVVDGSGNVMKSSSDVRLKKNIMSISEQTDVLASLQNLRGVYYNWDLSNERNKYLTDKREIGMIAQEVEPILPELVMTDKEGYKSIDYPKMTGYLIEVCKAQQKEIEGQKAQLEEQKKINEDMKARLDKLEGKLTPAVGR